MSNFVSKLEGEFSVRGQNQQGGGYGNDSQQGGGYGNDQQQSGSNNNDQQQQGGYGSDQQQQQQSGGYGNDEQQQGGNDRQSQQSGNQQQSQSGGGFMKGMETTEKDAMVDQELNSFMNKEGVPAGVDGFVDSAVNQEFNKFT